TSPESADYYAGLAYDNVLTGDVVRFTPGTEAFANALVHIKALPEIGESTNLPYTFYDRYTPSANRTADRRQPLPSTYAIPWSEDTTIVIWREATVRREPECNEYRENGSGNADPLGYVAVFDEHENVSTFAGEIWVTGCPCFSPQPLSLTVPFLGGL